MNTSSNAFSGSIKRFRHQNEDTGFFIAVAESNKAEHVVSGVSVGLGIGERVICKGAWTNTNWGPQFKAQDVQVEPPSNLEGIEMFLANSVPGIGKGFAKKLVGALGEEVFDVIESQPERLRDVPGIGKGRATSLVEAYKTRQSIRKVMVFLHSHGLGSKRAAQVYEKWGDEAVDQVTKNPYLLSRLIRGIGFLKADEVAMKLGISRESEFRVRAGLTHLLQQASKQGSCGLPYSILQEQAKDLLLVPYELIDLGIEQEIMAGTLIRDMAGPHECLFLRGVYNMEKELATRLLRHTSRIPVKPVHDPLATVTEIEAKLGLTLDPAQRDAAVLALSNNLTILTGGPGTGKTTISKVIIQGLQAAGLRVISLCAPTGKAAKRATEATGLPSGTVHRLLGFEPNGKFKHNEKNPLVADAIFIDEGSMLDVTMACALMRAIAANTRIIILGDKDQLDSVGAGKVLSDMIMSKALPCAFLKVIFRQAAASQIKTYAHMVNNGQVPPAKGKVPGEDFWHYDFTPVNPKDEDESKAKRMAMRDHLLGLVRSFAGSRKLDPIRDVQVLAPVYKGVLGVDALNVALQEVLNPSPVASLVHQGTRWGVRDKVMQQRNNYDKGVMNGDVGYILEVDLVKKEITVGYDDDVIACYTLSELDEIKLAYAFTIHKSQGSEFPVLIMPIDYSHFTMLFRSIVYTGITRAKKLCILLSNEMALKHAVTSVQSAERYTRLKEWLVAGLPEERLVH